MKRDMMFSGSFYPGDTDKIEDFINSNSSEVEILEGLKGVVVPHAGWIYSGEVALSAFSKRPKSDPETIILIGPSHRVPFKGVAITNYESYLTPFGEIEVNREFYNTIIDLDGVRVIDEAHMYEHSLEVQLPFIKKFYPNATLIPLVAGSNSTPVIKKIIKNIGSEVFIVCSTDLSHYHKYETAVEIDSSTIDDLLAGKKITSDSACGSVILNTLTDMEKHGELDMKLIKYCNSGDTAGDKDRVVGYCSMEILNV